MDGLGRIGEGRMSRPDDAEMMQAVQGGDATRSRALAEVLMGGSPTTTAWARAIGAAHAENAMRAVTVAESLVRR